MIISGLNDPSYPHEITHVVLRDLEQEAHPIIREGEATWLGGSINDNLAAIKRLLAAKSTSEVMLLASRYLDIDPGDKQESLIPILNEIVSTSSAKPGH